MTCAAPAFNGPGLGTRSPVAASRAESSGSETGTIGRVGRRDTPVRTAQNGRRFRRSIARAPHGPDADPGPGLEEEPRGPMLRLLHTADVHLGARHTDLGERAAVLRERQFTAFRVTVDLAVVEKVDLVLIAGDLFDSNTQPRRSVERVAAELGRLAKASIRTVIIPGTHDVYDGASIYRSYDLAAMARDHAANGSRC